MIYGMSLMAIVWKAASNSNFTLVCLVSWPLHRSEGGDDPVFHM